MAVRRSNPNFMNGVPELLILRLIGDREMYGYEIVQAIRASSIRCCTGWSVKARSRPRANRSAAAAASIMP